MELKIYKRGQGKYTRLCSGFGWGIIAGLGCWRLYSRLEAGSLGVWAETMIPAVLFALLAILVVWILNKSSIADFLIAAEGEIKKVSWSSRKEIVVSTFIVIVVVFFMAVLLGITDICFRTAFNWIIFS
ncbi:MAG: preprotein translocase subunit SecE [Planctomycetota bacterium]|jgi:preprotein translocase SecE subunit